jgi:hypothetical protein
MRCGTPSVVSFNYISSSFSLKGVLTSGFDFIYNSLPAESRFTGSDIQRLSPQTNPLAGAISDYELT